MVKYFGTQEPLKKPASAPQRSHLSEKKSAQLADYYPVECFV